MKLFAAICALVLVLSIGAAITGCGNPTASPADQAVRTASTNYTGLTVGPQPQSTLGTLWVIDTRQTSGSEEIFRVIYPGDVVDSIDYYISGTGPSGNGYYLMRVVDPLDVESLTDDYLYVSGT